MCADRRRVQFVIESMNACAWYRALTPARALIDRGFDVRINEGVDPEGIDGADVVVFQRIHAPWVLEAIKYCREQGRLAVYDIDDDLWNVHPDSGAHRFYSIPQVRQITEDAIRACDLVTTTTPHLKGRLAPLNRNVRVLPNMLPDEIWPYDEPVIQEPGRVVIGWAGSNTHLPDLKLLSGVVQQLLERFEHLEFAWAGMSEMPFGEHPRMRMVDPVPIDRYPDLLSGFHIGLAPVLDSVFNRSKSDLKFLEYARLGIPVVASRMEAYDSSIEHGRSGFLARNAKDWLKYLTRLIEDVELRRSVGRTAMGYARTRMISGNVGLWEAAYELDPERTRG